jgi:hypothetical protein
MAKYLVATIVAVLPLKAGSERYYHRGAVVSDATITKAGITHALSVGLISEFDEPEPEAVTLTAEDVEAKRLTDEKAAADVAAAAAAAAKATPPKQPAK